jgi:Sulfotransferase family
VSKPARFPDFFVVGAPRCGTTALCSYLAGNPQVCFSRPKEPHYFALLAPDAPLQDLDAAYLSRYFGHHQAGHRAIGEGSVSYLASPHAVERILSVHPGAKFIALLRDPLQMLPSYHLRLRFLLIEDVEDFATAWRLQDARARGERVPRHCFDPRLLLYRDVARFGDQVERLYRLAGRERVDIVIFDDLARDPGAVYRQVLAFLGLDDDGRTTFRRRYPSRLYRFRWLQVLLHSAASRKHAVDTVHRRTKVKTGASRGKSLVKRLARWNRVEVRPAPLTAEMRATLRDALSKDVAKLSDLLGRDLRSWLAAA